MSVTTGLERPVSLVTAAPLAALSPTLPPVSPRTVDWWRKSLAALSTYLGHDNALTVTRHDVERWQSDLLGRMSPVTANNYVRAVRIVYNRLIRLGYVGENPALVPYAPQPPHRPQAVTETTYQAMWHIADIRDRALLGMLWGTGCRIGELPTISLGDVEWWNENGRLCLAALVRGKYHRRLSPDKALRYVYADGLEAVAVEDWLTARPYGRHAALFPSKDGDRAMPVPTIHSILRKLKTLADLPVGTVCNAHAFRHAFAYRKRREGYPLEWVSEWLGHADPAFTARVYGDKSEPEIRRRFFAPPPGKIMGGRPGSP